MGVAAWGTRAALSVIPFGLPDIVDVRLNLRVLLVAVATTVATALACAVVPVIRVALGEVGDVLRAGQRGRSAKQHRAQHMFLVTQIALTLLLVGAGLMTQSLVRLWRVDPGFDPRGVITFMTGLSDERAIDPARVRAELRRVADQLATVPGVEAVSAAFGALPYTGNNNAVDFWRAGEPRPEGSDAQRLCLRRRRGALPRDENPSVKGRTFGIHDSSTSTRWRLSMRGLHAACSPTAIRSASAFTWTRTSSSRWLAGRHVKHWTSIRLTFRRDGAVYVPTNSLPAELVRSLPEGSVSSCDRRDASRDAGLAPAALRAVDAVRR